jgi:hypothetical protein
MTDSNAQDLRRWPMLHCDSDRTYIVQDFSTGHGAYFAAVVG